MTHDAWTLLPHAIGQRKGNVVIASINGELPESDKSDRLTGWKGCQEAPLRLGVVLAPVIQEGQEDRDFKGILNHTASLRSVQLHETKSQK